MNNFDNIDEIDILDLVKKFKYCEESGVYNTIDKLEFILLGDYYIEIDSFEEASKVINLGIAFFLNDIDMISLKAELLMKQNEYSQVLEILEMDILNLEENNIVREFILAKYLYQTEKFQEAIKILNKLLTLEEEDLIEFKLDILYILMEIYDKFEDYTSLRKVALLAIETDPNSDYAMEMAFNSFFILNDFTSGIDFFKSQTDLYPVNQFAWFYLGVAYKKNQNYKDSIFALENSVAIESNNEKFNSELVSVLYYSKNYQKAIDLLEDIEKNIGLTDFNIFVLANSYYALDNNKKAIECYKLIYNNPEFEIEASYRLADLYIIENKYNSALSLNNNIILFDKYNFDYMIQRSYIFNGLKNYIEQISILKKLITIEPKEEKLYLLLTIAYLKLDNLEELIPIIDEKIEEGCFKLYYIKFLIFYLQNQYNKAYSFLETALQLAPQNINFILDSFPEIISDNIAMELIEKYTSSIF